VGGVSEIENQGARAEFSGGMISMRFSNFGADLEGQDKGKRRIGSGRKLRAHQAHTDEVDRVDSGEI
jgi:hypothetical protein